MVGESYLIADTEFLNENLPVINGCLKGLYILGESWEITDENINEIIVNFSRNEDEQLEIYYLTEMIEFICLASSDNKRELEEYFKQLEEMLISMSEMDVSNKIMLQGMAVEALVMSDYNITQELKQAIKSTILQSQDNSGLFKGGDSNEDFVSFRDTYNAVILYERIN